MTNSGNPPKWKVLENTVAAIERSLNSVSGTRVIPNASVPERISSVPRQVDVYVEIPTGLRMLRLGVEVRDKSVPLDLPEVEQLIAKLKKLDLDFGCIVSRSGFTSTASEEAKRNGIELRTIAEIEKSNWWLATTMMMVHRQIELLSLQVNFQPEELAWVTELLSGMNATELVLTLENHESSTLNVFIQAHGIQAIDQSELAHLIDQDTFTMTIDFSDLHSAILECPNGPLPLPQNVYALYRLHQRFESIQLASYSEPEGVDAFTGISTSLGKQMTVVAKLREDGSRTLSFTMDDPNPSKTVIPQRGT